MPFHDNHLAPGIQRLSDLFIQNGVFAIIPDANIQARMFSLQQFPALFARGRDFRPVNSLLGRGGESLRG